MAANMSARHKPLKIVSLFGSQCYLSGFSQVVQCRLGTEREMVISLLQKYNDMAAAGTPLGIKSAFCHDHLSVGGRDGALGIAEELPRSGLALEPRFIHVGHGRCCSAIGMGRH